MESLVASIACIANKSADSFLVFWSHIFDNVEKCPYWDDWYQRGQRSDSRAIDRYNGSLISLKFDHRRRNPKRWAMSLNGFGLMNLAKDKKISISDVLKIVEHGFSYAKNLWTKSMEKLIYSSIREYIYKIINISNLFNWDWQIVHHVWHVFLSFWTNIFYN